MSGDTYAQAYSSLEPPSGWPLSLEYLRLIAASVWYFGVLMNVESTRPYTATTYTVHGARPLAFVRAVCPNSIAFVTGLALCIAAFLNVASTLGRPHGEVFFPCSLRSTS